MAGIKQPIQDILTRLGTLQVVNQGNQTVGLYTRVWNKQVRNEIEGKTYSYPKPAAFLEIISPATYQVIGQMYRNADISFRVHLVHEFYDAQDGTMEQDLAIFDLRDQVIALLTGYAPTGCGPLNCMVEGQDDDHDNVYEYLLDFVANFTDSKGSPLDPARNVYVPAVPPIALDVELTTDQGGGQLGQSQTFLINKP